MNQAHGPSEDDVRRVHDLSTILISIVDRHDATAHPGKTCSGFRTQVIARLAHAIGLYAEEHAGAIAEEMFDLYLHCPCHDKAAPKEPGGRKRGGK